MPKDSNNIDFAAGAKWVSFHQNVSFTPERWYDVINRRLDADQTKPTDNIERRKAAILRIQKILKEAEFNNKKVRAYGGTWSLSEIQKTTDYLINTNPLNAIDVGLDATYLDNASIDGKQLVFTQCGASVKKVNEELKQSGLALPTTGASDGQSIVGAFSTGTHGSAFTFGSMCDYVIGLHIITTETQHYWIEGNTKIVSDLFIQTMMPGATRINNDNVLNSAIVSFGSFGIIHAAMLQAEPLYELECYQCYQDWNDVKACIDGPNLAPLSNFNIPNTGLYNFSTFINPYKLDSAVVTAKKKVPFTGHHTQNNSPQFGPSKDVLDLIGKISDLAPKKIPKIMKVLDDLIKKEYPVYSAQTDIPSNIFNGGVAADRGKGLSVELGVDASQVSTAMISIQLAANIMPFPGVIALRYVKKTKATLGFAKYPMTCTIELPGAMSKETERFYAQVYMLLDAAGVEYTFHWGQCNNLTAAKVRAKYGNAAVDNWLKARYTLLPMHKQQLMFSNDFMKTVGLDVLSSAEPYIA